MIRVLFCDVAPLYEEGARESVLCRLSPERRHKADRFLFAADKALCAGAGVLLDKALKEYGLSENTVRYAYGPHGKPFIPELPEFRFNISHSGMSAVLAVSDREIGIDIEKEEKADLAVAKRFFTAPEYAYLCAQPDSNERNRAFFRIWTAKESFIKAVGTGLTVSPETFEIRISGSEMSVIQDIVPETYTLRELSLRPGYLSALSVRGDTAEDIQYIRIDL